MVYGIGKVQPALIMSILEVAPSFSNLLEMIWIHLEPSLNIKFQMLIE